MYRDQARARLASTSSIILLLSMLASAAATAREDTGMDWQRTTLDDLAAMHELIVSAHPGYIDDENPAFRSKAMHGYRQASRLAARVHSDRDSLAVLRFYLAGFEDGHLGVHRDSTGESIWAGFDVERRNGHFVVDNTAARWPVRLPPEGSRLISCDGRSASAIVEEDISPFIDRRLYLESTWSQLSAFVTLSHGDYPALERALPSRCLLELADGSHQEHSLRWQPASDHLRNSQPSSRLVFDLTPVGQGRFWVRLPSFAPGPADRAALQRLEDDLGHLADARLVVFDLRANTGGNSLVGARLLQRLMGGKADSPVSARSAAYALWRASPFALRTLEEKASGTADETYRLLLELTGSMKLALAEGQDWVRQPQVTLEAPPLERKQGRGFSGKLALLTDARCASACLDFADLVLSVPGAVHLGLPTSADTNYIDIGHQTLPSGVRFWLPLKVWRNRPRGHNQGYEPHVRYQGDITDTAALQTWTLDRLK